MHEKLINEVRDSLKKNNYQDICIETIEKIGKLNVHDKVEVIVQVLKMTKESLSAYELLSKFHYDLDLNDKQKQRIEKRLNDSLKSTRVDNELE